MADEPRAADDANAPKTKADTSWGNLPAEHHSAEKSNVNVYLDDFISVVQGGPRERPQMLRHLFHQIDRVFRTNEEAETKRKYPISTNKTGQRDGGMVHP